MRRDTAFLTALNIARYSALAAFDPDATTLKQFTDLKAPFTSRPTQRYARAVCEAIALEARIDAPTLKLEPLFVICSIAVHRHFLKLREPPAYNDWAKEARRALVCGSAI